MMPKNTLSTVGGIYLTFTLQYCKKNHALFTSRPPTCHV